MSTNLESRWLSARHEAGHIAAVFALNGRFISAEAREGYGLTSSVPRNRTDAAIEVAAGPAAEGILAGVPMPTVAVVELPAVERTTTTHPILTLATCPAGTTEVLSDDRQLALWAIGGYESEPERWVSRIRFVESQADYIIRHYLPDVIKIATALFVRGVIREADIPAILKGA